MIRLADRRSPPRLRIVTRESRGAVGRVDTGDYLAHLVLAGYRPSTVRARGFILAAFAEWISPTDIGDANRRQVEGYLARDLKPESRRAYRSALRGLYGWALDEGLVAEDRL